MTAPPTRGVDSLSRIADVVAMPCNVVGLAHGSDDDGRYHGNPNPASWAAFDVPVLLSVTFLHVVP